MNKHPETLSETLHELISMGYTYDFNTQDEYLEFHKINYPLSPNEFQIDRIYRFEGDSDPEYQSILYAISSEKFNLRGTLVNGYGNSADAKAAGLIALLPTNPTDTQPEIESNVATTQQREGNGVINATMAVGNFRACMDQVTSEPAWTDCDRNAVTLFRSETLKIVFIGLQQNAMLDPHTINGVLSLELWRGELLFTADGETLVMDPGDMVVIQANISHNVLALKESFFVLNIAMNQP